MIFLVLQALVQLLEVPNPDDALVSSIAEVYNSNRPKFNKIAKEYVEKVKYYLFIEIQSISSFFIVRFQVKKKN